MWKSCGKERGKTCGKVVEKKVEKYCYWSFSTRCGEVFHNLSVAVGKFSRAFAHKLAGVRCEFCTVSTGLTNTTIIL